MNRLVTAFSIPSRADFVSSLVVLVVALPLTLGIALASGASASSALLSAIVGGVLVGLLSGAPLVVSGPAAGLCGVVFMIIQQHGAIGLAFATILAGFIQFAMGRFKLGYLFTAVPKSVLDGMLAAIGLLILLGQLHVWLGSSVPTAPVSGVLALPATFSSALFPVLLVGSVTVALQLVWGRFSKKSKWSWIPAALPAVVGATLIGLLFDGIPRVEIQSLSSALGSQLSLLRELNPSLLTGSLVVSGLGLALVASAESLLTARAVEGMSASRGIAIKTDLNRELVAQGVGNAVCGLIGGLPMTGVIIRSAANIESGAKTRWSTIFHGLWIALFVLALPQVLNVIPLTALATILIFTGWKLLNLAKVMEAAREKPVDAAFWFLTVSTILATDLLKGLLMTLIVYTAYRLILRRAEKAPLGLPS